MKTPTVCDEQTNKATLVESHLTELRDLSRRALICSSCPWSRLWLQRSSGAGSPTVSSVRMRPYSDGGVRANSALEATTLTL